jgi:UDP-N-acetylglucosamine 1-carboxyvinyltransferase
MHDHGGCGRDPADDRRTAGHVETETLPYPGYPTDMQPQLMAMMARADGISVITEKIYPDRFIHVQEFVRMGADINLKGTSAVVRGVPRLEGAPVMASDLRAGAALVIGALAAEGESLVRRIYHVDRGYEQLEKKLEALGASIKRVSE